MAAIGKLFNNSKMTNLTVAGSSVDRVTITEAVSPSIDPKYVGLPSHYLSCPAQSLCAYSQLSFPQTGHPRRAVPFQWIISNMHDTEAIQISLRGQYTPIYQCVELNV